MDMDISTIISRRAELYDELFRLCKAEGMKINKVRMQHVMNNYNIEDIERMIDAFERFGVNAILSNF